MYSYEKIKQVHLEVSSACNASCPLCLRNELGRKVNGNMPVTELTLDDVRVIFPAQFIRQLNLLYLCGNYGDPMVAHNTLEILEYFRENNASIRLGIYTNGSGQEAKWWARLAQVVDYCRFGIDGLADTNHIYRRGTRWEKIMASVEAFIAAGGQAEWDFIVFRHNEHQVDAAREVSRQLGFKKFFVKKTYRFFDLKTGRKRDFSPVFDHAGNLEYFIYPPNNPGYLNPSLVELDQKAAIPAHYRSYLDTTLISCKAVEDKMIYVSAEGLTFPCCWTGNIYPWYLPQNSTEIWQLIQKLPEGKDSLNAKMRSLKEIIEGPFFQQLIPEGWHRQTMAEGKLEICSRVCGNCDLFAAQYTPSSI